MISPIEELHALGQSVWYDNIQRRLLENGQVKAFIPRGEIWGMTSNPTIFNQAIARSSDYDSALTPMAWAGYSAEKILDQLMLEDIRTASDLFLPVYRETGGADGFVSIEVSPDLAYDTTASLAEALRLWKLVNRPNLMIKIPATPQGIPAIRQAIASGLNVNITLIFSIARYIEVMDAYISGLEERLKAGLSVEKISSVASFFVSRIDTKVDQWLEKIIQQEETSAGRAASLLGKLAVANARLAYTQFRKVFEGERFSHLKSYGARLQRPLWASTSTKNPVYADTKYVDELIGPFTVSTVPQVTLDAFRNHGNARPTVEEDLDSARRAFDDLAALGLSIDKATQELETEGVQAFAEAYHSLLQTIESRRQVAVGQLGTLADPVAYRVQQLEKEKASPRMHAIDPTLWTEEAAGKHEIRKRLGWLTSPEKSHDLLPDLGFFANKIQQAGYSHAILLGMGGSSLAPEVYRQAFGNSARGIVLITLDSTDPDQVRQAANLAPVDRTLFIVSSKSGTTAEVEMLLDFFWEHAVQMVGNHAGEHFIAITDPGTPLEELAKERNFRRIFLADPKVGGRYSALTAFGLVPAALLGLDVERLLRRSAWMARQCAGEVLAGRNPGLVLGAVLGEAVLHGRDKLTLVADPELATLSAWLEQLVAESSGKQGKGILPIDGEPLATPGLYGADRLFVHLRRDGGKKTASNDEYVARLLKASHPVLILPVTDNYDLGAEFYRWEFAIAIACVVLGVNPFDQPDVQDSKARTNAKIAGYRHIGKLDEGQLLWQGEGVSLYGQHLPGPGSNLGDHLAAFIGQAGDGDYIALNAYLPRSAENESALCKLRKAIQRRTHLATTLGFGPRYLHSIGQLHKGGKNNGLFLEITSDPLEDLEIPEQGLTFGVLERAQALGDLEALQACERRVLRIHLLESAGLQRLIDTFTDHP